MAFALRLGMRLAWADDYRVASGGLCVYDPPGSAPSGPITTQEDGDA